MRAALDEAGYDGGAVWRRMERVAAALLVALRPSVEVALARRRMRGASAFEHHFELLRFDFLVDEDAQARCTSCSLQHVGLQPLACRVTASWARVYRRAPGWAQG